MPKTESPESEKQYRGFQVHIEGNFAESHPFTAEWEDGLAVYFPIPKPVRFKICADAFRTACHLIDVQYEAESQAACQYFNPGAKP